MSERLTALRADVLGDAVQLASYEDVRFVLRSRAFGVTSHMPELGGEYWDRLLDGSLAGLDGEEHFERRRIESQLFRREMLARYETELVKPVLRERLVAMAKAAPVGQPPHADLVALLKTTLFRLMARIVGLDGVDSEDATARLEAIFDRIDQGIRIRFTTRDPSAVVQEALEARQALLEQFLGPSLARRRDLVESGRDALPHDLITLVLTHRGHFGRWDEDLVLREATLFIAGAVGTTVNHSCHTVEELCTWIERHPEDEALLTDRNFLQRALEEELRKWSILPEMLRLAHEDVTVPSGVTVRAGQVVRLAVAEASAEVMGDDGLAFNPHRHRPARVEPFVFAFGNGPHTCIGKPLVLGEPRKGDDGRVGSVRTILAELFAAGVRGDPTAPPTFRDDNARSTHLTYPVVFTRLEGAYARA